MTEEHVYGVAVGTTYEALERSSLPLARAVRATPLARAVLPAATARAVAGSWKRRLAAAA